MFSKLYQILPLPISFYPEKNCSYNYYNLGELVLECKTILDSAAARNKKEAVAVTTVTQIQALKNWKNSQAFKDLCKPQNT